MTIYRKDIMSLEFEALRRENLKNTISLYNKMKSGEIPETENYKLSQNIDESRLTFLEQGYMEYDDPKEIFDPSFQGKKCRYILKNGLVRMGGRVVRMVDPREEDPESIGDKFIFIRPFVPQLGTFQNGWSVQLGNIKYFYVSDLLIPEVRDIDDKEVHEYLQKLYDTKDPKYKNQTKMYDTLKDDDHKIDKRVKGVTKRHVIYFLRI